MYETPFGLFFSLSNWKIITVLVGVKLSLPAALEADLNITGHYCVRAISPSVLV